MARCLNVFTNATYDVRPARTSGLGFLLEAWNANRSLTLVTCDHVERVRIGYTVDIARPGASTVVDSDP
jgi:hypothetical protein